VICGKEYTLCPRCPPKNGEEPYAAWRHTADTPKHYQLFIIVNEHSAGILSTESAIEQLDTIGWKDMSDEVLPVIREYIETNILTKPAKSKKSKKATKPTPEPIAEPSFDVDETSVISLYRPYGYGDPDDETQ
jgi:hypothetical protein